MDVKRAKLEETPIAYSFMDVLNTMHGQKYLSDLLSRGDRCSLRSMEVACRDLLKMSAVPLCLLDAPMAGVRISGMRLRGIKMRASGCYYAKYKQPGRDTRFVELSQVPRLDEMAIALVNNQIRCVRCYKLVENIYRGGVSIFHPRTEVAPKGTIEFGHVANIEAPLLICERCGMQFYCGCADKVMTHATSKSFSYRVRCVYESCVINFDK